MQTDRKFHEAIPKYRLIRRPDEVGVAGRRLFAVVDETKLRRILGNVLDENEFLGPYGIRSLSRYHRRSPVCLDCGGQEYNVNMCRPNRSGMFGGNSNWRGPVWMPVNMLVIRGLVNYLCLLRG